MLISVLILLLIEDFNQRSFVPIVTIQRWLPTGLHSSPSHVSAILTCRVWRGPLGSTGVSRRVCGCCVWSSTGIYNQQMSACPLPPRGRLMLFQSVSVCEGVGGVIENDKGAGGYYNWGLKQKKQLNPPQTAFCCPNTHRGEMHESHRLCPDDPAPWVKSRLLLLFWGLWGSCHRFTTYRNMQRQTVDNNTSQRSGSQQQNNCSKLTFAGSETDWRPGLTDWPKIRTHRNTSKTGFNTLILFTLIGKLCCLGLNWETETFEPKSLHGEASASDISATWWQKRGTDTNDTRLKKNTS